jgi:hypothetical protein
MVKIKSYVRMGTCNSEFNFTIVKRFSLSSHTLVLRTDTQAKMPLKSKFEYGKTANFEFVDGVKRPLS